MDNKNSLILGEKHLMIYKVPHYYKDFTCIASECRDNCCLGGWQIDIDDETFKYYKTVPGKLGEMLMDCIDTKNGCSFKLQNGSCPFLDDKNLCRIYKELGEDRMGVVCRQFPRFTEYYGNVKETGIGLACEEAARIILEDNLKFNLCDEIIQEEPFEGGEYDVQLGSSLFVLRGKLISLCDNHAFDLFTKLQIMTGICFEIQNLINENDYMQIDKYCQSFEYEAYKIPDEFYKKGNILSLNDSMASVIYSYLNLESLGDEWNVLMEGMLDKLHPDKQNVSSIKYLTLDNTYKSLLSDFMKCCKSRFNEYNNIIKYYLFRYFMKASFDYNILGKIQLIISNIIVFMDLDILKWSENNKVLTKQDRYYNVHIFSKQIEYSDENISSLYEEFLFDDIFNADSLNWLLDELKQNLK